LSLEVFVGSGAKMVHATEPAGIGLVPGAGRTACLCDEDGEQHSEQAQQQADDGEAASEHCVVSPSIRTKMPEPD
jgi:hypothetical protein